MDENQVGVQVGKIGNEAKSAAETVVDLASKARSAAVETGSAIRDKAIETGRQVSDAAAETYRRGVQASEYVKKNTAEQPLTALLVAGAIGFGLAYMIFRDAKSRRE